MDEVRIFISYAREDQARVKELYQRLVDDGFTPWLDREHIIPGMRWEPIIKKALKQSDFVLVCLSASSINKRGFLQREIKQALEQAEEKLEHDVYLIPARLDDCDVPEVLSAIQWVDLFEEDGWQWLLKAIEYGLKQSGKTMPTPVSSGAQTDTGEERRQQEEDKQQQEEARQRELEAQRQRELEAQRRDEAARLAEEKRRQEAQQRLQEQVRQRELQTQRQLEQEAQRQREQEAQRQRELAEQQRRAEAARQLAEQQRRQKEQELKTPPLTVAPAISRRAIIGAALTVALIALVVWLALKNGGVDQSNTPANGRTTPGTSTASPAITSSPVASPSAAPVEVLRYLQEFEPGIGKDGYRFYFKARMDGYLYLIASDQDKKPATFLTNRPPAEMRVRTNQLQANREFAFPAGTWLGLAAGADAAPYTLIFSSAPLDQSPFLSASEVRQLTPDEEGVLEELRRQSAPRKPETEATANGGIIKALPANDAPLVVKITARRKSAGN